jgi:hypothetical protein
MEYERDGAEIYRRSFAPGCRRIWLGSWCG